MKALVGVRELEELLEVYNKYTGKVNELYNSELIIVPSTTSVPTSQEE